MITQEELKEVLHYDPDTGVFTWIKSRGFIRKGSVAGGDGDSITFKDKRYRKAKLAWLYMTGNYPMFNIYLRDRNTSNLRFNNLTTNSTFKRSKPASVDVNCIVNDIDYNIFIIENGDVKDLGVYDDIDDALQSVKTYVCSR